jgi:hypothetical protein
VTRHGGLLGVNPDGTYFDVINSYNGIKDFIGFHTPFDFIVVSQTAGFYIDDEGMLNGSSFNVPASMFALRALYGPIVLCAAAPDDEGDTLPPTGRDRTMLSMFAASWQRVTTDATRLGQNLHLAANPDTIPPATVTTLSDEMLRRFFGDDET